MNLLDYFDRAYVINLPERTDRRREVERELRSQQVGLRPEQIREQVEFFPAIRPAEAAPFAAVGIKGCSLSHLAVLRQARSRRLSRVLVLEDDVEFGAGFSAIAESVLSALAGRAWGLVQLGYMGGPEPSANQPVSLVEYAEQVLGTHCYAVSESALDRLIALFEEQHQGTPGDDLHGPMPADGTLNVFKWLNPELIRLVAVPSLVRQRSSKSDVTPNRFDRLRVLAPLMKFARVVRARTGLASK